MTGIERTAAEIVVGLLLIFGFILYERHEGAKRCENADKTAVAAQEAHNAAVLVNQQQTIAQEKKAYEDALLQPISAPVVRLCVPSRALPQTPTAPASPDAAPALRTEAPVNYLPGPDIGFETMRAGQGANAVIAGLQDYIRKVCLK